MKKNIFVIIGSASSNSANLKLVQRISSLAKEEFNFSILDDLTTLPHFNADQTIENTPEIILKFRESILNADAVLFCTPEYIFSIPGNLKSAIEWCVSTTVFSNKPTGIITASANGRRGHEELQLILRTVGAIFTSDTTLLIQGVKGKIDNDGNIKDAETERSLLDFIGAFRKLVSVS